MNQLKKALACLLCFAMLFAMVTPVAAETVQEDNIQFGDVIEETLVLKEITVTAPTKVAYLVGEALDTTGMVVTAVYEDETTQTVTEGYEVTGYDAETVGEQTVTVTYKEKTATFTVTVEEEAIIRCINGHTSHDGVDCDEPIVTWKYWNQKNAEAASSSYVGIEDVYKQKMAGTGNWILIDDLTLTAQRTTGNGNLRIDLNGHTITRVVGSSATTNNARAFFVYDAKTGTNDDGITPTLAITDLSTEGEAGSVKLQHEEGVTTLATGALVYAEGGPFTLAGRAVLDGSDLSGIAVYAVKDVTMYGGTVKGGTSEALRFNKNTADVALKGDVKIQGTANFMKFTNASIEGNVQIDNLVLPYGKAVTLGQLGDDAQITINADGFCTNEAGAAVLQGYLDNQQIKAGETGTLTVQGDALYMAVEGAAGHRYCILGHTLHVGATATCEHEILTWDEWTETDSLPSTGNWVLTEDVTTSKATVTTGNLRIDLNGHNITRNIDAAGLANIRVFTVNNAAHTLVITDLSTEGEAGTVGVAFAEGVQPYAAKEGVAAFVYLGTFVLAGRAVLDGSNVSTTATSGGVTVQVNNAGESFVMYGGTIKGVASTGTRSGAIHGMGGSTIAIHGGLITSEGTEELAAYAGGNFTMDGGKIVGGLQAATSATATGVISLGGNAVIEGGVNLVGYASAEISGNAQIVKSGGSAYGVNIPSGKVITIGELGDNAKLSITASGVFTTAGDGAKLASYVADGKIVNDDADLDIALAADGVTLTSARRHCINGHGAHAGETADCPEEIVTWKLWNQENAEAASSSYVGIEDVYKQKMTGTGNWILIDDLTLTAQRTTGNGNLRIDLNGHNITRVVDSSATTDNARAFYVYDAKTGTNDDGITPTLAITDLSTEGEAGSVKLQHAEGVTTLASGALVYAGSGPFTLSGRAVLDGSNLTTTKTSGGVTVLVNGSRTFTMYGGTIKGLASSGSSSSALSGFGKSVINIHGGEITSAGTDEVAAYTGGTFTMDGGKIVGGLQAGTATVNAVVSVGGNAVIEGGVNLVGFTSVEISGNAQIVKSSGDYGVKIPSGKVITIGELGENAKLSITASGVFTTAGDGAKLASYVVDGKIVNDNADLDIALAADGVTLTSARRHCINGHGAHAGETADCPEEIVNWYLWNNTTAKNAAGLTDGEYKTKLSSAGNWILTEDVILSGAKVTGGNLRIDLNGHNIIRTVTAADAANTRVFTVDGDAECLSITDLSTQGEAGTVSVAFAEGIEPYFTHSGVAVFVYKGSFKLAGRAVLDGSNVTADATTGGVTVQVNGGTNMVMYGGTIKGLAATETRASAIIGYADSTITIHGGVITSEGTEERAAYMGGDFTMDGGQIVGGMQAGTDSDSTGVVALGGNAQIDYAQMSGNTSVTVSGTPTIGIMQIAKGKAIDFTGVTGGSIAVRTKVGIFSTAFETADKAEAALKFITAADEGKFLEIKDNALRLESEIPELVSLELTAPTKTEYWVGEELNLEGMELIATYSDGSTKTIEEYEIAGFSSEEAGEKTVVITVEDQTVSFTVTVSEITLTGITLTGPSKVVYVQGELLDLSDMTVTATYSDGTTQTVEDFEVEGFDSAVLGEQTVTIKVGEATATFTVTVVEPEPEVVLTGITVTAPTKTEYEIGEELVLEGMVVTGTYSDESTAVIAEGFTTEGFDSETAGEKTVTVTYEGFTATFTVTVKEPVPEVEIVASGNCGTKDATTGEFTANVTWKLDVNGVLTISGEGATANFTKATQPWKAYRNQITSVVVKDGVTFIGKYAFYYLKQATTITIPASVTNIATYAGLSMTGVKEINYACSAAMWQRIVQALGNERLLNNLEKILKSVEPVNAELKLVSAPTKLQYLRYEALDLTGLELLLVDAEGNEVAVNEGEYFVYGYKAESMTTQVITVVADGLFVTFNVNVRAEGYCGAETVDGIEGGNIKWTLTDNVLELTGTGATADYTNQSAYFRKDYINDIKSVKVNEGITYLGKRIFYFLIKLGSVRLPLSLETIADGAFYKTRSVVNKYFAGTAYQWTFVNVAKNNETLDAAQLRPETLEKIVSLEVTTLPTKLTYVAGVDKTLDTTGIQVTGHYDDGSTKDLTTNVKYSGFSATNPNVQTITVNYGGGAATTTFEVEMTAAGTCANGMTWTIEKGVLTVTGEGAMDDYTKASHAPWWDYRSSITEVVFSEGITHIGAYAMYFCKNLVKATIPEGATIGSNAFLSTGVTL